MEVRDLSRADHFNRLYATLATDPLGTAKFAPNPIRAGTSDAGLPPEPVHLRPLSRPADGTPPACRQVPFPSREFPQRPCRQVQCRRLMQGRIQPWDLRKPRPRSGEPSIFPQLFDLIPSGTDAPSRRTPARRPDPVLS